MLALSAIYVYLGSAPESIHRLWFNSDTLLSAHLYKDLFVDHFPVKGWEFPTAPSFFPDILLCASIYAVAGHSLAANVIYGIIQFAAMVAAFQWLGASLGLRRSITFQIALFASAIGIAWFVASESELYGFPFVFLLFIPTTHAGSFLMVAVCSAIAFWLLARGLRNSPGWFALYGAFAGLAAFSDLLFVTQFVLALSVALGIAVYLRISGWKRPAVLIAATWACAVAGVLVKEKAMRTFARTPGGLDRVGDAFAVFVAGVQAALLERDALHLISLSCMAAALLTALILIRRHIAARHTGRGLSKHERLLTLFLLYHVIAAVGSVAAPIATGIESLSLAKDYTASLKYMMPLFIGPFFVWPILIGYWMHRRAPIRIRTESRQRIARLGAAAAMISAVWLLAKAPAQSRPLHADTPAFELVRILDENARSLGLKYGLGGYWETRAITLLSQAGLRAYPVDPAFLPFPILSNRQWFAGHPTSRHPYPEYSFVILNGSAHQLNREDLIARIGPPSHEFQAAGHVVLVFPPEGRARIGRLFGAAVRPQ